MNLYNQYITTAKEFITNYTLNNKEQEFVENLLGYFFNTKTTLDISKGIMLKGTIGTGKTMFFRIVQRMLDVKFAINPALDIVDQYNIYGDSAIQQFQHTRERLIDEIGREPIGIFYTNPCEVIEKVLLFRYNLYQNKGIRTHLTTNCNDPELKERYKDITIDRFRELFNICIWPTTESKRYIGKMNLKRNEPEIEPLPDKALIRKRFIDTICREFQIYKENGKQYSDFGNRKHDFLVEVGLITKDVFIEYACFAKEEIEKNAVINAKKIKEIDIDLITNKSKQMVLYAYYDQLIETNENIKDKLK